MGTGMLDGRRVVVIGASAGIGRAAAVRAVQAGAEVVLGARRQALLDEAVEEAGGGTAIAVDLRDPAGCARFSDAARQALGEIDAVLFTAGAAPLRELDRTTADEWTATLATNVVALNLITSALLPALTPAAFVTALSSEAVGMPRYALGAYGASKAALEHSLRGWRLEHPEVRFSTITVGATVPTDFGTGFDPETLDTALRLWAVQGLAQTAFMDTVDVAEALLEVLATALGHPGIGFEHLVLRSPSGVTDDASPMIEAAAGT